MSKLTYSFYLKKLEKSKKKLKLLKKLRKGAVLNESTKEIAKGGGIEGKIKDTRKEIIYYQEKVYGSKRFDD